MAGPSASNTDLVPNKRWKSANG